MANKAIFSYGNGGTRKLGHSKFDMGFEHLMSANFGGLHPAAVFETLPDDYWDISDNTVTLLKPLTAPAFTRINQNFYGAYVRNQQIWKYWNDFISNGTSFGDVYGNNVTNQSLQNVWEVPSIPTSYLQVIQKIGSGNATPVWPVEFSADEDPTVPGEQFLREFLKVVNLYNFPSDSPVRVTDAVYAFLQFTPTPSSSNFDFEFYRKVRSIGFDRYGFDAYLAKHNSTFYLRFDLYCSFRQFLAFRSVFNGAVSSFTYTPPSSIGDSNSGTSTMGGSSYPVFRSIWRFFADDVSPEPKTSTSAFLIEKSNYTGNDNTVIKSMDYYPRVVTSSVDVLHVASGSSQDFFSVYQCLQSPYWGFRYVMHYTTSATFVQSSNVALPQFDSSSDFYWSIDANWFGYANSSDLLPLFESWSQNVHYLGVTTSSMNVALDDFGHRLPALSNFDLSFDGSNNNVSVSTGLGLSTSLVTWTNTFIHSVAYCDCAIDLFILNASSPNSSYPIFPYLSRESLALGYDASSMVTYLCNNSLILQDEMGIKVDPLSQRPLWHYRFELTNALPFFAYDKIWNDNFRNSVVSSPSLDWSESNGVIFANASFYQNFVFNSNFIEPSERPARYKGKVASDFDSNGWTLEIVTFPRNSQGSKIHTHLPISGFQTVLNVLVGFSFDRVFCGLSNTDLNVTDYYLPSYYNGLLHLKYQNFNKDYFTSAMLDPMSGANQVAVGSTINELRENEAKQHWWERTAMYRSIKHWFQGTYGITPIELPEDSRITGTDHIDVAIGEVIQTSGTTPESPQGSRSGLGGARGSGSLCHGHANEHGWIFILVSHTIESQYLQVFDKMWDVKESFLDYPTVDFAGIGNESILQKELNYTTVPTSLYDSQFFAYSSQSNPQVAYLPVDRNASISYNGLTNPLRINNIAFSPTLLSGYFNISQNAGTSLDNVFGFIPRYSSYKFKFDQVSGQFRHELNFWHTFKRYLTMPILCHEFVNWEMAADDDDINRIFAVSDDFLDDKFTIDCFINASVDRALPFVCVPSSK